MRRMIVIINPFDMEHKCFILDEEDYVAEDSIHTNFYSLSEAIAKTANYYNCMAIDLIGSKKYNGQIKQELQEKNSKLIVNLI